MREIKFRAWSEKEKQFVDDFLIDRLGNGYKTNNFELWGDDMGIVISQYTGLKDKNRKEIYEGDIVKILGYEAIGYVYYKKCGFWIQEIKTAVDNDTTWSGTMGEKVIGNIYENPELLEQS